jgi:glycosyltransferase involved in cell wall biosynthesis
MSVVAVAPRPQPGYEGRRRNPSVSVIIATRDRPESLQESVLSVCGQEYDGAVEVIVVLDQSDPVHAAVESAPSRSVRVVRNERSPGLPGARNTGLIAARGDLVAFCDDDDVWVKDKLKRQVPRLMESGVIGAGSGMGIIRTGRRMLVRLPPSDVLSFRDFARSRNTEVHPSSLLFRRARLLEEVGLVDEDIPGGYAEDWEFLLRLTRATPLTVVREPLVWVRWHSGSWFVDRWEIIGPSLEYLMGKHPELGASHKGLAHVAGQIAFAHAASGARRQSFSWSMRAMRAYPFEVRPYLALAVSGNLMKPAWIADGLRWAGRGM